MKSAKPSTTRTTILSFIAAATIVITAWILKYVAMPQWIRLVVALIPTIPTLLLIYWMAKAIGKMDELQQKIQIEGLALAFGGTSFLTLVYGMLKIANIGLPDISLLFVYTTMILLYGIGTIIAGRRYQ